MNKVMDFAELSKDGKVLVSVYGTLKQGWGNHRLLNKSPKYTGTIGVDSLDGVGFPIVKLGNRYKLYVEVYEVDESELRRLDSLEGYRAGQAPHFYDRKVVDVDVDGAQVKTYVYEYVSDVDNNIESECLYASGVYTWGA